MAILNGRVGASIRPALCINYRRDGEFEKAKQANGERGVSPTSSQVKD
jgi:hypothetical protein